EGNVSAASPATTFALDTHAPTVFATNIAPTEFGTFSGVVATYTDANGGGTATIDWGDGSPVDSTTDTNPNISLVHLTGNNWEVVATHAYQSQGTVTTTVTVTDAAGNAASPATASAVVGPPAITVVPQTVYAVINKQFSGQVASFNSGVGGETAL